MAPDERPPLCGTSACTCDRASARASFERWDVVSDIIARLDRGWLALRDIDAATATDVETLESALNVERHRMRGEYEKQARMRGMRDAEAERYVAGKLASLG